MIIDGVRVSTKVLIPGKLMFSGEYAVLFGGVAVSSSLNTYMEMEVIKNNDRSLKIYSSYYPEGLILKCRNDVLGIESLPLKKALMFCLDHSEVNLFQFDIKEKTHWDSAAGFGGSSAIILSILSIFLSYKYKKEELLYHAYNIQKKYQGHSSGYDMVTQMYGGVIEYRCLDNKEESDRVGSRFYEIKPATVGIDMNKYIHIFTSSIGSNTSSLIKKTLPFLLDKKKNEFMKISNDLSMKMLSFLNSSKDDMDLNITRLFDLIEKQQNFFYDMDDYPNVIKILKNHPLYKKDFIVKTTGAGGSDAILLIGDRDKIENSFSILEQNGWKKMIDPFSKKGVYCEY